MLVFTWSTEERKALDSGVSATDIRAGILTKKEADAVSGTKRKNDLNFLKKDELIELAKKYKLELDPRVITRGDLMSEITKARKKSKVSQ